MDAFIYLFFPLNVIRKARRRQEEPQNLLGRFLIYCFMKTETCRVTLFHSKTAELEAGTFFNAAVAQGGLHLCETVR